MMTKRLPQMDRPFLQYTGNETDLIFNKGIDLPNFSAYPLLEEAAGQTVLAQYYDALIAIGAETGAGVILDTYTWTANPDRAAAIGYTGARLAEANRRALVFAQQAKARAGSVPAVVSGMIGPRADGYAPAALMTADEAADYHRDQIAIFAEGGAEMINAFTLCYAEEAIGIARTAAEAGLPVAISFTVETDGRLPTGAPLGAAIAAVDAATGCAPAYYLVNCAHPDHVEGTWRQGEGQGEEQWMERLKGFVANASRCSHAELDAAVALDDGDPEELGGQLGAIARRHPHFTVFGGCCGTDLRHIAEIARRVAAPA